MNKIMGALWNNTTQHALRTGNISINTLESLAAARLVRALAENRMLPVGYRTVEIRVDTISACACINAGRARSITMRRELKIMSLMKVTYNVRVSVAELLNRGHFKQASVNMGDEVQLLQDERVIL